MITLHQIQLTNEDYDLINEKGHGAVPAHMARIGLSIFGSEKWKPEFADYFTASAKCNTNSLDEAFEVANLWTDNVARIHPEARSASVGDLLERDGEFFLIEDIGFTQINL